MRIWLFILVLFTAAQTRADFALPSSTLSIETVLRAQTRLPRWDDLLQRLDNKSKIKVLGYASASGAAVGALSGIKTEGYNKPSTRLPKHPLEMTIPADFDTALGAATGAALGGVLGASHILFADSEMSDSLRDDPKNPYHLRKHLIRLVPRIRARGLSLALNASF